MIGKITMEDNYPKNEKVTVENKITSWVKKFGIDEKNFWKTVDDSVKDMSASYFEMTSQDASNALDYLKSLTVLAVTFAGNKSKDLAGKMKELQNKLEEKKLKK